MRNLDELLAAEHARHRKAVKDWDTFMLSLISFLTGIGGIVVAILALSR